MKRKASGQKRPPSAKLLFDSRAHAACLAHYFQPSSTDIPIISFYEEVERLMNVSDQEKVVNIETMLTGQALALQSMMTWFAMRARDAKFTDHLETYAHLALKAQRQCRATLATLAEIKNPRRVIFVKNRARYQQVNLGHPSISEKEPQKTRNGLLRSLTDAPLDEGRAPYPVTADPPLETLASLNRAEDAEGEGTREPKRAKARAIRGPLP